MDMPQQFEEDREGYEKWCAERDATAPPVPPAPAIADVEAICRGVQEKVFRLPPRNKQTLAEDLPGSY